MLDPAICYNREQNLIYVWDVGSLLSKLFGKLDPPGFVPACSAFIANGAIFGQASLPYKGTNHFPSQSRIIELMEILPKGIVRIMTFFVKMYVPNFHLKEVFSTMFSCS